MEKRTWLSDNTDDDDNDDADCNNSLQTATTYP
jgi:hypothetical protein